VIRNEQWTIRTSELASLEALPEAVARRSQGKALRWYVSRMRDDEAVVEVTLCDEPLGEFVLTAGGCASGKSVALSIIPTGIGCSVGGYAGDAAPATSLLAAAVDYLVTNPNAVNASDFIRLDDNVVYTEGSTIDLFCQGLVDLHLPRANRVGLIVERSEPRHIEMVFNVLNAVRAIHGVDVADCVITEEPIGGRCVENRSGAYSGTIDHPEVLFKACEELLAKGVTAVAVTSNIQDLPPEEYAKHFAGAYPNPVGGVEAVISHLITRRYRIPAAHAPLRNMKQMDLADNVVDARGAGEMASTCGLACVLIGLRRAPQIRTTPDLRIAEVLDGKNLLAVVTPASCLGGVPALATRKHRVPLIAVRENETVLDVTAAALPLGDVVEVGNYAEAAGVLLALRRGISLQSIVRPLKTLRPVREEDYLPLRDGDLTYEQPLAY